MQTRFVANAEVAPGDPAPTLDLDSLEDRTWLESLCRRARAPGSAFSARDYYPTLLWHLLYKPSPVFRLDEDTAIIASVTEGRLDLHDVIATRSFDLRLTLPRLIARPIQSIAFGFGPEDWWPQASVTEDSGSYLFARALPPLVTDRVRFPDLAQT